MQASLNPEPSPIPTTPKSSAIRAGWISIGIGFCTFWIFGLGLWCFSLAMTLAIVGLCTHQVRDGFILLGTAFASLLTCIGLLFVLALFGLAGFASVILPKSIQHPSISGPPPIMSSSVQVKPIPSKMVEALEVAADEPLDRWLGRSVKELETVVPGISSAPAFRPIKITGSSKWQGMMVTINSRRWVQSMTLTLKTPLPQDEAVRLLENAFHIDLSHEVPHRTQTSVGYEKLKGLTLKTIRMKHVRWPSDRRIQTIDLSTL